MYGILSIIIEQKPDTFETHAKPVSWKSVHYFLYYAHALTSWGNRMWRFCVGIFLIQLSPNNNLRLTALYGFLSSLAIFVFGPAVGKWIDKNARYKVAKIALITQNGLVTLCALGFLASFLIASYNNNNSNYNSIPIKRLLLCFIILTAVLADIAAMISHIIMDKDWVVIVAQQHKLQLSSLNAQLKRIDLLCNILTPLFAGQILALTTMLTGVCIVMGWNICSGFLEFWLISSIYARVPRLAYKTDLTFEEQQTKNENGDFQLQALLDRSKQALHHHHQNMNLNKTKVNLNTPNSLESENVTLMEKDSLKRTRNNNNQSKLDENLPLKSVKNFDTHNNGDIVSTNTNIVQNISSHESIPSLNIYDAENAETAYNLAKNGNDNKSWMWSSKYLNMTKMVSNVRKKFVEFTQAWKLYMGQRIRYAGISLALLYLTVLGFDSITVGYAYAMGMTENIIGIMVALGALFGILGTFAYPKIKSRYGIHKAGVIALIAQITCLSLCILAFWLPGSHWFQSNATKYSKAVIDKINNSSNIDSVYNNDSWNFQNHTMAKTFESKTKFESTKIKMILSEHNSLGWQEKMRKIFVRNMSHIWLFIFGIVLSRLGLWMADLTLNQILQECVVENQKGIINGIQHSLIMIFENVKYAAVIVLPSTSTFGWLVILSFLSICTALLCFLKYVSQVKKSNLVQKIPYQYKEKSKPFEVIREILLLTRKRDKETKSNTNFQFSKTGSLFSKSEHFKQSNQYVKQQTLKFNKILEKKDSMTQSVYDPIMTIPCNNQATK